MALRVLASAPAPRSAPPPRSPIASSRAASTPEAPLASRASRLALVAATSASIALAPASGARAETLREMYVAAGNAAFLEKEFSDLKYAGVKTVTPGLAGGVPGDPAPVRAVRVTYDADRISHEALMRSYWQRSDPTNAQGQFREIGPEFRGAIWVSGPAERLEVETSAAKLERSGIFGAGRSIVIPVLDAPPASFDADPEDRTRVLALNPKSVEKEAKAREAAFKDLWGFVQFCADRVCGYVRFAPKCVGECLDVFPQFTARNAGIPELDAGNIKVTGRG